MTRMTATVLVMALLVLFMLAGALPAAGGQQAIVFSTPVFIGLLGLLAALIVACVWSGGWKWSRGGFLLTHLGVVAILAGALVGHIAGEVHELILPVRPGRFWTEVPIAGGRSITFPFAIACNRFTVDYYDEHPLANGGMLRLRPAVPRQFTAELTLQVEGEPALNQVLKVNHPVVLRGWRIYLVSFKSQRMPHVVLKARRDPGRGAVVAGIWMVMVGTLLLGAQGWGREGGGHESC